MCKLVFFLFAVLLISLEGSVSCLNTTFSSVAAPAPTGSMSFSLLSPITGSAPFTLGFSFVKGHIASGQSVAASNLAEMQVIPKNYWTDGSLKYAILSGHASLTANTPLSVTLGPSTVSNNSPLTLSDLKATGLTAAIDCESYGSVSWQTADWDSPHLEWISGWQMSNWIYRKPVGNDPHLVAWLDVRLYKGGAVEILPWIENGFIRVPYPTNKTANFKFQLGSDTLFYAKIDLPTHRRTPLLLGTALSYWFGASDPAVTVHHDTAYLQATLLVPSYFADSDLGVYAVSRLVQSFVPLQQGNFDYDSDSMPSSGYQRPIGMLPEHDVAYLTSVNASRVYKGVVFNGYSAGRYPIHWRDENTQKPLRFEDYPHLVIHDTCRYYNNGASSKYDVTPPCNGTAGPSWDPAHSPTVGYLAYLVTGRWYFMEEVQFAATTNYLGLTDTEIVRNFSSGILHSVIGAVQTRSSAWMIRALAMAYSVTPDTDDYRTNFKASWENNIRFFHTKYVAQQNNNFGIIQPGEAYDNGNGGEATSVAAIWQHDFVTAAWGLAIVLDLPVSDSSYTQKLGEFFQWKAQAIVGRLGTSDTFWYINAAPYTIRISNIDIPDFQTGAGPWLADWSAVYAATFAKPPTWLSSQEGVLSAEFDIGSWPKSMWGNLQPAISYAVQLGVPGAVESYFRMLNATNWPEMKQVFNIHPVWSVTPAKIVSVPAPVTSPPYAGSTPTTTRSPSQVSTSTGNVFNGLMCIIITALLVIN